MYKYDYINYENNKYELEFNYVYNIINSTPAIVNVYKHDENSSIHIMQILLARSEPIFSKQVFIKDIPEKLLEEIAEKIYKNVLWRYDFNRFLERFKWFIQEENQIIAQAFTILYLLNPNNFEVKPSWKNTEDKVTVTQGKDQYTINVDVEFDGVSIIIKDYKINIYITVYNNEIIFSNLIENITKEKLNYTEKELNQIIKRLTTITYDEFIDYCKIKDDINQIINKHKKEVNNDKK